MKEKQIQHSECYSNKYDYTHTIIEKEDSYEIEIKMIIKKGTKEEKMIEECIEKQKSPVTRILGKLERKYDKDKKHGETVLGIY